MARPPYGLLSCWRSSFARVGPANRLFRPVRKLPRLLARNSIGSLDRSLVHPREVFRPAIKDAAKAILLVHNHPSGDPTPSDEDFLLTKRLEEAGKTLGIQILDHIVVARTGCSSIQEIRKNG